MSHASPISNSPAPSTETRKRKRLTHACTQCRARKIRCDEARPKCTNCEKSGAQCVTVDPRGVEVQRREAQRPNLELEPPSRTSTTPTRELLPALPRHASGYGNSLSMLSQWLDLAFFRLKIPKPPGSISPKSRPTRKRRVGPASNVLGGISHQEVLIHTKMFMARLNTVFPIFTQSSISRLYMDWERASTQSVEHQDDLSFLLMVLIVAANVQTSQPVLARACMDSALCNLHLILDDASARSIQALLLLSIINRSCDDILHAANMISLAASTSQALGLHRKFSQRQNLDIGPETSQELIQVWWSVYTLEKIISIELGRMSSIRDFECNQILPAGGSELFQALIALAQLQSEVNERFAMSRHMEETSTDRDIIIGTKMRTVGELDQKLLDWTHSLPSYAQTLSSFVDEPEARFALPFMALQYWQTLFFLHRNALLLSSTIIINGAEKYCMDKPYRLRLKNGHNLCCGAARMIVSILNDVYEHNAMSVTGSSYAPLTAAYALGIHILKNPQLGLARADCEIQHSATELVTKQQLQTGTYEDPDSQALRQLLDNLRDEVGARLDAHSPATARSQSNATPRPSSEQTVLTSHHAEPAVPVDLDLYPTSDVAMAQDLLALSHGLPLDMTSIRMDMEYPSEAMDMMNIDWEALALAYDLPSQ